ncbi:MAG: methylmalonyl Co-A mutase-associated GTPase MeaB [Chromatiaceae bacterium]|nr:methylmalonyl Co-A mutase-associated GTPase MeaB [Gammaproteobacteria bacterium]MCB1880868.1 methylmalonyl Co-A mutase-associated GTPase MeaB [Gammaproteobacteria bacterium]MCP5428179.1 methylmalonyl Co-A mutase-associated GTPase MeaB [Chromatiaceae bacterium]MCP5448700.1 methylmalonyl Co-A mutase-associated GTPase MeaB [Chromatiaceae bacterium]
MLTSSTYPDPDTLAAAVTERERPALAKALNLLDDKRPEARRRAARLLRLLPHERLYASGHLIGLTGPPGAGKSSLTAALITIWRKRGLRVAVLAVDPSSPISGGALLGDRLRMFSGQIDNEVFIRSLACRGEFGGLSAEVWPMSLVMLAAFDIVLVETVGVGQKEIDVSRLTDTTVFVAQPASGDSIQFLKAGIMEVPHLLVVNKADLGLAARKTLAELRATLKPALHESSWQVPALAASAAQGTGIAELADGIDAHRLWLLEQKQLSPRRKKFQAEWVLKRLGEEFGRFGIESLGGTSALLMELAEAGSSPFEQYDAMRQRFLSNWNAPQRERLKCP